MRTSRLAGMSLALLATTTLSVAGCTRGAATPGVSSTASTAPMAPNSDAATSSDATDPAATAALSSAAAALDSTSFKVAMTAGPGLSLLGLVDAPNGAGTATLDITAGGAALQVKTMLVGADIYVQVPGVTVAGQWTHVDAGRLPEGANVGLRPDQIDPANTARLLSTTTEVRQVDSRNFRGSVDLTRVAGVTGIDKVTVDGLGTTARRVPFTAGLDEQGRLSVLTIDLPAAQGQPTDPLHVRYSDYGLTVAAEKPAADTVTEAPEVLYQTLGG